MAKDNRQKKAQIAAKKAAKEAKKLEKKNGSASSRISSTTAPKTKRRKKGLRIGRLIVVILALCLIVAVVICLFVGIKYVKNLYSEDSGKESSVSSSEKERSDVAYYVFGMMGETNETTGKTGTSAMLSLVCYDKQAKTINVLQIPPETFLGDKDRWKVNTIGNVWTNPKELKWCENCRRQVFDAEIKDGKHAATLDDGTTCDTKITSKTGSAVQSLMEVFSYQYTIAVDNFFIMPQEAFVKLVDLVGGVDIKLSESQTLGDIDYESGVQTIDGAGALEYVLGEGDSINEHLENYVHQRQVYVALFERLFTMEEEKLNDDVIYPLMKSSTPIRTKRVKEIGEDIDDIVSLLKKMNNVERNNIHVMLLPGERTTYNGKGFYSVHKTELCKLLNSKFNPYDTAVEEQFLRMTELANSGECNIQEQSFDKLLVKQSGFIELEEEE